MSYDVISYIIIWRACRRRRGLQQLARARVVGDSSACGSRRLSVLRACLPACFCSVSSFNGCLYILVSASGHPLFIRVAPSAPAQQLPERLRAEFITKGRMLREKYCCLYIAPPRPAPPRPAPPHPALPCSAPPCPNLACPVLPPALAGKRGRAGRPCYLPRGPPEVTL